MQSTTRAGILRREPLFDGGIRVYSDPGETRVEVRLPVEAVT